MITLFLLGALYFLPTIVASHRGHGFAGILTLNLLFGWTVIGWFLMLLWALTLRPVVVIVNPAYPYAYGNWRRY